MHVVGGVERHRGAVQAERTRISQRSLHAKLFDDVSSVSRARLEAQSSVRGV
jgi:hypothetical protein